MAQAVKHESGEPRTSEHPHTNSDLLDLWQAKKLKGQRRRYRRCHARLKSSKVFSMDMLPNLDSHHVHQDLDIFQKFCPGISLINFPSFEAMWFLALRSTGCELYRKSWLYHRFDSWYPSHSVGKILSWVRHFSRPLPSALNITAVHQLWKRAMCYGSDPIT